MPHYSENKCTRCGNICSAELLTIKRASFSSRTTPNVVKRSRTTDWLCETCLEGDPEWNLPAYKGAPGMTSPALERVRNNQVIA